MCQCHLNPAMEPLLTPQQLADLLGLSVQTLYNRRSLGASMPPAVRIGTKVRFRPRDVEDWLAGLEVNKPAPVPTAADESAPPSARRRGRPTKAEQVRARQRALADTLL